MNTKMLLHRIITCLFAIIMGFNYSNAQDIPQQPKPPRLVNDLSGILTPDQINNLERKLVAFNDTTSNQIAIVIVNSLNGMDKAEFADRIGQRWGVGQKKFDNGIVLLLKPKDGNSRGQVHIATGYGLEGAIPDATAKRIVEYEMIPHFKRDDYFTGLDNGINALMLLASGEYSERIENEGPSSLLFLILFIFIIALYLIIRHNVRRTHTLGKDVPLWTAFWLGSTMMGSSGRRWGSGSSGSFGGGGFGSGSSFGGFGGGGFGGGGAGGSW